METSNLLNKPVISGMILGVTFFAKGLYSLTNCKKSSNSKKIQGIAEMVFGAGLTVGSGFLMLKNPLLIEEKLFYKIHPYEEFIKKKLGSEAIFLNPSDSKPKLLFLQSSLDNNGAFEPEISSLKELSKSHDIRYKVIKKWDDICEEIDQASALGEIQSLIISAHGKSDAIQFESGLFKTSDLTKLNTTCFSKLSKNAEVSLVSCETGKSKGGFAATLAKTVQRIVWSPQSYSRQGVDEFYSNTVPARPIFYYPQFKSKQDEEIARMGRIVQSRRGFESTCMSLPEGAHYCGYTDGSQYVYSLFGYGAQQFKLWLHSIF